MDASGKLVAARFLDKRLVKGSTADFRPSRSYFHVSEPHSPQPTRVDLEELKGVFFLKTPGRSPDRVDRRSFGTRSGQESKVWIEFADGERLAGWSNSFGSLRAGFYVFPADPESNLEKAYVFRSAIRKVLEGEEAEVAASDFRAVRQARTSNLEVPDWDDDVGTYRLTRDELRREDD